MEARQAVLRSAIPRPAAEVGAPVIGYGKSFASFGEVVQGRTSDGEDFLITLPIDLWSTCELVCSPLNGPLVVECDLEKSRAVLYHVLSELGVGRGYHLQCKFTRNIPVGKGLSSSTADMLATMRAVQEVFGFLLSDAFVSRIFAEIEPHDGLHFNSSVTYNHRRGRLLDHFGYVPGFTIIAVDEGGSVDTVHYNRELTFSHAVRCRFDILLKRAREAYGIKDDRGIADCATESSRIHLERTGSALLRESLEMAEIVNPLGILATHSGTCAGFLYARDVSAAKVEQIVGTLSSKLRRDVFVTRTLRLLD